MDNRISLCVVIDSLLAMGGAERQVLALVKNIDAARFRVHLCCLETCELLAPLKDVCTVRVFPLDHIHSLGGARQALAFNRYLNKERIEIVHAFNIKACIFSVLGSLWSDCPVVITSRLNMGHCYTARHIRMLRVMNRYTTRVLANSYAVQKRTVELERLAIDKIDVIYNGVPTTGDCLPAKNAANLRKESKVVGIVANLRPVKDLELFLRAARIVVNEIPEATFLIVGQGPLRAHLETLAAALGIGDRVHFSSAGASVQEYLSQMSVGCLSSKSEGFSNALLECMAAGLPVVATDVGGNSEAVQHGVTGFLVEKRTADAFAAPIVKLLRDESVREEMGRQGFMRCREVFSVERMVQQYEMYYAGFPRRDRGAIGVSASTGR